MKRCVRCGKFISDDEIICSDCEFEESPNNEDSESDLIKLETDEDETEYYDEDDYYDDDDKRNNKWRKGVLVKRRGRWIGRNSRDSKFGWGMALMAILFGIFLVVNTVTSTNILTSLYIVIPYWLFLIFYTAALYMADEGRIVFTANGGDETFMLLVSILIAITSFIGWEAPLHPALYVLFAFATLFFIGSLAISVIYNSGDILGMLISIMAKIFVIYFSILVIYFFVFIFLLILTIEIIIFLDDYYDRKCYRRYY